MVRRVRRARQAVAPSSTRRSTCAAGKTVRLAQGDYTRETVYGDDPVAIAVSFVDDGASWIHVVDLDAAANR